MPLFGSSGIRSFADRALLLSTLDVGLATGSLYHPLVVGADTRTSSGAMKHSLIAGLLAAGSEVHDAGLVSTPALAYATRKFAAGAMITASHNPPEYNGVKLWNPDGSAFDAIQRISLEESVANVSSIPLSWEKMRRGVNVYSGAVEEHISRILDDFPGHYGLKVVVDGACGAASLATPHLLRQMGCEVVALDCYPSGYFPRSLEPTPESLTKLMEAVISFGAHLGIAHDGDGDRMMAVDDRGQFVSGDKLLVYLAGELGAKKVVTTVDSSMLVEEHGMETVRTRVGDAFVSEELTRGGDFGGEPSGTWIFPQMSLCPDGIYAAAFLVKTVATKGKLSQSLAEIPEYPVLRGSLQGDRAVMLLLEKRLRAIDSCSLSTVDGLRLGFKDGWVLVRPSGTEPKIRITAEGHSRDLAEEYFRLGLAAAKSCLQDMGKEKR